MILFELFESAVVINKAVILCKHSLHSSSRQTNLKK